MTSSATVNACASAVEAYEKLRCYALTGTTTGGAAGLIILLRQGVAVWMTWLRRCCGSVKSVPLAPAPHVTDEFQAALVRVLASMALGSQQEVRV